MPTDAYKNARGFSYQRQYAIYYFLTYIGDTEIKEIIEDVPLPITKKDYEDITFITNNNKIITYQIKHNEKKQSIVPSNSDLFKTIGKQNNMDKNVKIIKYIVSKNDKGTFDEYMLSWVNKELQTTNLYDKICTQMYSETVENSNSTDYKKCRLSFNKQPKEQVINYLNKIKIEEGFTYEDLKIKIIDKIKNKFMTTNNVKIFCINYYIFELFDNNWFMPLPQLLNINNEFQNIKNKMANYDNDCVTIIINIFDTKFKKINEFINKIKKNTTNEYRTIDIENAYYELLTIIDSQNIVNKLTITQIIIILQLLHKIYLINVLLTPEFKKKINKKYIFIRETFCLCLLKYINTNTTIMTDIELKKINITNKTYGCHEIKRNINFKYISTKLPFLNINVENINECTKCL
jgi:hypothetical protein